MLKPKAVVKLVVDILMTIALLGVMGYQFWGEEAHEWVGAGLFVLFIIHHILNGNWHRNLLRGKYTPVRILQTGIDLLVFLAMLGLMVSGVMMSNYVFDFLPIHGGMSFARLLHMTASHWGYIFMALHLGLHWGMFPGLFRKWTGKNENVSSRPAAGEKTAREDAPESGHPRTKGAGKWLPTIVGAVIAVYGVTVFIRRDFLMYLFVRTHFVFLDYEEPVPLFYLDYLALMGTFIFAAYFLSKGLRRKNGKRK